MILEIDIPNGGMLNSPPSRVIDSQNTNRQIDNGNTNYGESFMKGVDSDKGAA